jgi:ribosomal protein S18 acetylase RimI-like enzyme
MDKDPISINSKRELDNIELIDAQPAHYGLILSWFSNKRQFEHWAGPSLGFPSGADELQRGLQKGDYKSFALVNNSDHGEQVLLGFGQIQFWPNRAHVGRLVIAPEYRGKGLSYVLVNLLIEQAVALQKIQLVSLFVYNSNTAAKTSYKNLGFVESAYPQGIAKVKDCSYMTLEY